MTGNYLSAHAAQMSANYLASYVIQCSDGTKEYGDRLFSVEWLTSLTIERARNSIKCPEDCEVIFLSWTKLEVLEG